MFNSRWLFLAVLTSFSSFGAVSFKEKQLRVDTLMKLQKELPAFTFEAYRRELDYEKRGLSLEARSKNETNLLAEKIRSQVYDAFQAAAKELKSNVLAREEVKEAIERDLEQAAPELKEEISRYANDILEYAELGRMNQEAADLAKIEAVLRKEVAARKAFLNDEDPDEEDPIVLMNGNRDSEKKDYNTRDELISSLVSDRESSSWVSTANQTVRTAQMTRAETKVSMQVKMEFLGAEISAGPSINFRREIGTEATLMAEGLNPVVLNDGTFDRFKRDNNNKVEYKNGKAVTRYISMACDVDMRFSTEYKGAGGFKYMGMGADVSYANTFQNVVNLQSRRVALPVTVANKTMTVKFISELCHGEFLKAKISNAMTVRQSLDLMMKNVISGLVFSNPKNKCAQTSDCADWFKKEVITMQKRKNTFRCVEDSRDKFRFCQLRGLEGQNCAVFEKGKKTSSGKNEFPCDAGLRCVKTSEVLYFLGFDMTYSEGQCQR